MNPISNNAMLGQVNDRQFQAQLETVTNRVESEARKAQEDGGLREAFDDFVGQTLFGSLLKEMRKSEQGVAYLDGGQAEKVFRGQLDQVLVEKMTDASASTLTGPMYDLMNASRLSG